MKKNVSTNGKLFCAISDIPGVKCRKKNSIEPLNHRIYPGGSMGKMIGRGMPNILLFYFISQRLAIKEAKKDLS